MEVAFDTKDGGHAIANNGESILPTCMLRAMQRAPHASNIVCFALPRKMPGRDLSSRRMSPTLEQSVAPGTRAVVFCRETSPCAVCNQGLSFGMCACLWCWCWSPPFPVS